MDRPTAVATSHRCTDRCETFALTYMQQSLWLHEQVDPGTSAGHVTQAVRIIQEIDPERMRRTWQAVTDRHGAMRTTFHDVDGSPVQRVHGDWAASFSAESVAGWGAAAVAERLSAEAARPFDLEQGPLARCVLLSASPTDHIIVLALHHLVTDMWSMAVLGRNIAAAYRDGDDPAAGTKRLPGTYSDFVTAERELVDSERGQRSLEFWREALTGVTTSLDLPLDHPRTAVSAGRGAAVSSVVDADVTAGLVAVAETAGATLESVVLAAFQVLLHRYSGNDDIVVGTLRANRSARFARTLGCFVNEVAVPSELGGEPSFLSLASQVQRFVEAAGDHARYPFQRVVQEMRHQQGDARGRLFDVSFGWQKTTRAIDLDFSASLALGVGGTDATVEGMRAESVAIPRRPAPFDMSLFVAEIDDGLAATLQYDAALFDAETIHRLVHHFQTLLAGLSADPQSPISDAPLLSDSELSELSAQWSSTVIADTEIGECAHQQFQQRAAATPDASAVALDDDALTYRQLNTRANRLARHLRATGVHRGDRVAIYLDRSIDTVVSILAVLKAGAAYTPIDAAFPTQRVALMIADASPTTVISTSHLDLEPGTPRVDLDRDAALIDSHDDADLDLDVTPTDVAYVLYTSGSSGQPKGVLVEHRNLVNFLAALSVRIGFGADDALLSVAGFSFDMSVLDVFVPLVNGGRLVIAATDTARDGSALARLLSSSGANVMHATPTTWRMLIEAGWDADDELTVLCGGEALTRELADQLLRRCGALWNVYGPTEATVCSSLFRVEQTGPITIGDPIANVQMYTLDRHGRHLPIGVKGELVVAGAGVARGYLGLDTLTAERFVADPNGRHDGARMYRTGDLARRRADGTFVYLGRSDHQVKIRGYRIELGEIEATLARHPAVEAAAVLVDGAGAETARLIAYVTGSNGEATPDVAELRAFLRASLPDFMVPAAFVELDAFPLTSNNKIDRRALEASGQGRVLPAPASPPPQPGLETDVAAIWEEVLDMPDIGRDDNFFDLGGHSLLATRIASRLRATIGVETPVRTVFDHPTVASLSAALALTERSPVDVAAERPAAPRGQPLPVSFSQERMWFLHQLQPTGAAYNIPFALRLRGALDVPALEWSLNRVIARHESLRTIFVSVEGSPAQVIVPDYSLAIDAVDHRDVDPSDRLEVVLDALRAASKEPFDLARLPLARFALHRLDDDDHILFVCMHHIISDQWSLGVLGREAAAFYRARLAGTELDLADLAVQQADYASWQRDWLGQGALESQLAYWREQLADLPVTELDSDRPRPIVRTSNGASLVVPIPDDLSQSVQRLVSVYGVSPFMILLGGFTALLHRYTGADEVVVGSPVAGRNRLESEHLVSSLVNTLVMRTDVSGNPTFAELLGHVRDDMLDAYTNQDVPFSVLVDELRPSRDASRSPLFQIFFNVPSVSLTSPDLGGLDVEVLRIDRGASQFDLSVTLDVSFSRTATLEFNTDLFDADRIERLLEHYWQLLRGLLADPQRRIGDVSVLTDAELGELRREWAATAVGGDRFDSVHAWFEWRAAATPGRPAASSDRDGAAVSYGDLNAAANRLARHLIAQGVTPGDLVGIHVERSVEMIVALIGVLKAGAGYVPLDPAFPRDRLVLMLDDAAIDIVVSTTSLPRIDSERVAVDTVSLDGDAAMIAEHEASNLGLTMTSGDVAYVMYTSGSTGRPKGVQVEHGNVVNMLRAMAARPGFGDDDVMLSVTTLSFDISVLEIFLPLVTGGHVVVAEPGTTTSGAALAEAITATGATVMQATPTTWRLLVDAGWQGHDRVRALCGGESLAPDLAVELIPRCGELWNMYGPTETTVWSSISPVTNGDAITIGRAIDNTRLYVLDAGRQLQPVGVAGELYIGGDGVARGYLGRDELTADRFVADPYDERQAGRMYRTGDAVRRLASGEIEFLGRLDDQVKIRGHRVELGEIEAVLRSHPAVDAAVVATYEQHVDDVRLVAYVVPTDETRQPEISDLRAFARRSLPEFMVPNAFVTLARLPRTANNKIDRRALPGPDAFEHRSPSHRDPPRPGIESTVAEIWSDVLGVDAIARDDDFFDLGGHSLLAIRVFARLEAVTGQRFPVTALFQAPTVAGFAELLQGGGWETPWTSLVAVQPDGDRQPLFHVSPFLITALSFTSLGRRLGAEQPLYALQPQGLDGDDPIHETIEAMAAHYIAEVKTVQPVGPYAVGGHCAGSWVAVEMARQLRAGGDAVNVLILVDADPPGVAAPRRSRLGHLASRIVHYSRGHRLGDAVRWKFGLARQRLLARRTGSAHQRRAAAVRRAHNRAHQQYRGGVLDGDAMLIRSAEWAALADKDWHVDAWRELITGDLTVRIAPGTHAALVEDASAAGIAEHIREALDERGL